MSTIHRIARIALENPDLRPHLMPVIREAQRKRAHLDLPGVLHTLVRDANARRQKSLDAQFKTLINKLEKELLQQGFGLDQRKSYIEASSCEATQFEGQIVFKDLQEFPRSLEEVQDILQSVLDIWDRPRMIQPSVWQIQFEE